MKINKIQKRVLVVCALGTLVTSFVYVPFRVCVEKVCGDVGFGFLFWRSDAIPPEAIVNIPLILVELLGMIVITIALMLFFKDFGKEADK